MRIRYSPLFALILSACTQVSPRSIDPDQVYQGYPCGQNCAAFQAGYEAAQAKQLSTELDCAALPIDQATGCQTYLFELKRSQPGYTDFKLK